VNIVVEYKRTRRNVLGDPSFAWRALVYFSSREPDVIGMDTDAAYVVPSIAAIKVVKQPSTDNDETLGY
jgi:hypothetical protein